MDNIVKRGFPLVFLAFWEGSQHMQQCSVKPFYLSVPLGVVRCCSQTCYATKLFQSVKEFVLELPTLIMKNLVGKPNRSTKSLNKQSAAALADLFFVA